MIKPAVRIQWKKEKDIRNDRTDSCISQQQEGIERAIHISLPTIPKTRTSSRSGKHIGGKICLQIMPLNRVLHDYCSFQ